MPINTTNASICETSNIFTGGGPGDQGALVEINGQQFIPSPFINISLEKYKMDNIIIGGVMKITLNGVVVDNNFTAVTAELLQILGSNLGANSNCVNVKINCGGTFINGYGRIISVNISEGQQPTWVNLAPYSVEIELYENNASAVVLPDASVSGFGGLCLSNFEESFTVNINEDTFNWGIPDGPIPSVNGVGNRHVKLDFSISAAGVNGCSSGSLIYGLGAAESVIQNRIGSLANGDLDALNSFQTTNLDSDIASYLGPSYLELRSVTVNTMSNSISVSGSIIYRTAECSFPNVLTTLNVSESVNTDGTDITISGTINGLYNMVYTNIIADLNGETGDCNFNQKMLAAEIFLNVLNQDAVLSGIATAAHGNRSFILDNCTINGNNPCGSILPYTSPNLCDFRILSTQIDKKYADGSIDFSFVLSNKNNCSIPGASKVDIEITHDRPHDNIVEILVPGRGNAGSIIQNLCCKSPYKMTISLNAVLNTSTCSPSSETIDNIRACAIAILNDLKANTDPETTCWFVTNDQETTGNNSYRILQELVKPDYL